MRRLLLGLLLLLTGLSPASAHMAPPWLSKVGFDQHLDAALPLATRFQDEAGREQPIGDYFGRRPVILVLDYYRCKNLCGVVMDGLLHSLRSVGFTAGQQYNLVAVSIDPRDTPAAAAAKKAGYQREYNAPDASGWHFLTGKPASIRAIAQAAGFRYVYDRENDQYVHAAGVVLLTPQGRISRYLYGVKFAPRDLRLGLVEAAGEKIGTPVDYLLLLCCRYDPKTGKYSYVITNTMRGLAAMTLVLMGGLFWRQRVQAGRGGRQ